MKKVSTLVFLLISIACHAQTWKIINPTGGLYLTNEHFFLNKDTGWVVGNANLVAKTTNAGKNWTIQNTIAGSDVDWKDVQFLNKDTGWIVGTKGYAAYTTNGGTTWEVKSLSTYDLNAIFFLTRDSGWIAGATGRGFRTSNGGMSWTSTTSGSSDSYDVIFTNNTTGFRVGENGYFGKSTNSGATWTNSTLGTMNLTKIFYTNQDTGWITGLDKNLRVTYNGGIGWTIKKTFTKELYDVVFLNKDTGIVTMVDEAQITYDGGTNWTRLNSFTSGGRLCVSQTAQTHFIILNDRKLLQSTNRALNWDTTYTSTNQLPGTIQNGYFVNRAQGWMVGNSGFIAKTTDSCRTWTTVSYPTAKNINSVYALNKDTAWLGGTGIVLRTYNGGASWDSLYVSANAVEDIQFINKDTGFCISTLFAHKTVDGGNTWTTVNTGSINNLTNLRFRNADTGFAGGNMTFVYTCNGGVSWTKHPQFANGTYSAITFYGNTGFVTGSTPYPQRTYNGGLTWSSFIQSTLATDAVMLSPGTLIMAQSNFKGIWRSTDSLNSLQSMGSPVSASSGQRILYADSNYLLYRFAHVLVSYEGSLFDKAVVDSISADSFYSPDSLLIRYYGKGFNSQTDAFINMPLATKTVKYISDKVIEVVFKSLQGRGYYNTYLSIPGASGGSSKLFGVAVYDAIPAIPSTNLAFKNRDSSSITLSWTPGNGTIRAVIVRKNSPVILPGRNTVFPLGLSSPLALGNDQYLVYNSASANVNITGLEPNTTYYVAILEYRHGIAPVNYNLVNYATASFKTANVYYNKTSGVLNKLSSWSNKPDGSGTQPVNFEDSFTYYLGNYNQTPSFDSSWTVGGNRSYVVLGNGTDGLNYVIQAGVKLTVDSIRIRKNITLTNYGDFSFRRSAFDTGSLVQFVSTQPQNISPATYYNVTVIGGEKTLSNNAAIAGNFNMVTNINSNTYTLALTSGDINSMTYVSGVVKGKISRLYPAGIASDPSQELFPLGTNNSYKPLRLSTPNTTNTALTLSAEFVDSAVSNAGLPQVDASPSVVVISKVSNQGFWRVLASSSRQYNLAATATGVSGVSDSSKLRLVKRTIGGTWGLQGTAQAVTGTAAAPVISRTGLSGTGEYGIGSDSVVNPLPVKLISFEGMRIGGTNKLYWSTASEVNNKGFYVYRSTDRKIWDEAGFVAGKGNVQDVSLYAFDDGINGYETYYYFLGQSDFNGALNYSDIITVAEKADKMRDAVIFPNPLTGNRLSVHASLSYPAQIRILNSAGIPEQTIAIRSENELENINLEKLAPGLYLLEIMDGTSLLNHKLIKH